MLAPEEEAFRSEVVEFLAGHGPVDGFFFHEAEHDDGGEGAVPRPRRAGLVVAVVAGRGRRHGPCPRCTSSSCGTRWRTPGRRARRSGPGIVAKTIIRYGTDEQRQRFLPGLRAGTTFFSLGYSEPEAGSDLAGVRTRAVRDGDHYVLTGEKRWTSGGHRADYLWVLCRTGTLESHCARADAAHRRPACRRGISISPIPSLDGERFNEVRFDDVSRPGRRTASARRTAPGR